MNKKTIDKSKKSNIKCEHCKHGAEKAESYVGGIWWPTICNLTGERKKYWNRCKRFEWKEDA